MIGCAGPRIGVVGAGSIGLAVAAVLQREGRTVTCLVDDDEDLVKRTVAHGRISLSGMCGNRDLALPPTTTDRSSLGESDIVLVAVPANRHEAVARETARWLSPSASIVLMTGYVAGTRLFSEWLSAEAPPDRPVPPVYELNSTPYLACSWAPGRVHIGGVKAWCELTSDHAMCNVDEVERLRGLFPQAVPTGEWLASELNNPNPIAHVPAYLCNLSQATFDGQALGGFFDLSKVADVAVATFRQAMEGERVSVMRRLGLESQIIDRDGFGRLSYPSGSREENPPRIGSMFLPRFIAEDVPCGLVPLESLARSLGVEVPVTSSMITFSGIAKQRDFRDVVNGARTLSGIHRPAAAKSDHGAPVGTASDT